MKHINMGARCLRAGAIGLLLSSQVLTSLASVGAAQPFSGSFSLQFDDPNIALAQRQLALGSELALVTQEADYLQATFKVDTGFTVCSCGGSVLQWHGSLGVTPGANWAPSDGWRTGDTVVIEGTVGSTKNGGVTLYPGSTSTVTYGSAPPSFVNVPALNPSGNVTSLMVSNQTFSASIQLDKLNGGAANGWGGNMLDWLGMAAHMPSLNGAPAVDSAAALTISSITFRHATSAVPESSTDECMGLGMLGMLWVARKRRQP